MTQTTSTPLTVVLVQGAFADASSWAGVIERLQAGGIRVTAPANPRRGISIDSAYVASLLDQIDHPVLAVEHSYAGAEIRNTAARASNVVGLVYIAAFAPDEGERFGDIGNTSKDRVLNSTLVPLTYPTAQGSATGTECAIDPSKLQHAFAGDLSAEHAALLATTQRPSGTEVMEVEYDSSAGGVRAARVGLRPALLQARARLLRRHRPTAHVRSRARPASFRYQVGRVRGARSWEPAGLMPPTPHQPGRRPAGR